MREITLTVNGEAVKAVVSAGQTLVDFLRQGLELTGTKKGCERGECGVCTVLVNGHPLNSCLVLAVEMEGQEVVTIEGLVRRGELDAVQRAFVEHGAIQCGFCTPGMILTAKAHLEKNPHATAAEIKEALSGNLCRCGGYQKIVEACLSAAKEA